MRSKIFLLLTGVIVTLVTMAISFVVIFPKKYLERSKNHFENMSPARELLTYESQILSDKKHLSQFNIFNGSKGTTDASAFLSKGVGLIPESLITKMKSSKWYLESADTRILEIDYSWMENLHNYDVWSPEVTDSRIDLSLKPEIHEIPIPDYSIYLAWAKLRLLQGRSTSTFPQALKDVRQLARLIYTNDNLVAGQMTVAILKAETRYLKDNPTLVPTNWTFFSEEDLKIAKRYLFAVPNFTDPRLDDDLFKRLTDTKVGECIMANEGMNPNHLIRDQLNSIYPHQVERFNLMMIRLSETCRKGPAFLAWEDKDWKAMKILDQDEVSGVEKFIELFIDRKILTTFAILEISSPDFLKLYKSN